MLSFNLVAWRTAAGARVKSKRWAYMAWAEHARRSVLERCIAESSTRNRQRTYLREWRDECISAIHFNARRSRATLGRLALHVTAQQMFRANKGSLQSLLSLTLAKYVFSMGRLRVRSQSRAGASSKRASGGQI